MIWTASSDVEVLVLSHMHYFLPPGRGSVFSKELAVQFTLVVLLTKFIVKFEFKASS